MKIKKVAIVGFGQFGRFMAQHLTPHVVVVPVTSGTNPEVVASCDVVIFAVPYGALLQAASRVQPFVAKHALILDVTSVKQKPLALLRRVFKGHQILGTHPIFGPQSGKGGIAGLPIVLCNTTCTPSTYTYVRRFLKQTLALQIIEQTAKEHDH
jgi:prephenate dehydrogenase